MAGLVEYRDMSLSCPVVCMDHWDHHDGDTVNDIPTLFNAPFFSQELERSDINIGNDMKYICS